MQTKRVVVVPYNAAWPLEFQRIKGEITAAVGPLIVGVAHIGSTSVPGLAAKPCIDIDVVIENDSAFDAVARGLGAVGYIHEGNLGIPGREAFRYTGKEHLMAHHLYVCPQNSQELRRHITFRNFLRENPDAAAEYGAVKTQAARLYPNDIEKYIAYKTPCIERLYARCGLLSP